jgi:hypothetical protein
MLMDAVGIVVVIMGWGEGGEIEGKASSREGLVLPSREAGSVPEAPWLSNRIDGTGSWRSPSKQIIAVKAVKIITTTTSTVRCCFIILCLYIYKEIRKEAKLTHHKTHRNAD